MFAWVVTTPLGRPVVPLVYTIIARRDEAGAGNGPAAGPARASPTRSTGTPALCAAGPSALVKSSLTIATDAAESRRTYSHSPAGWLVARGTAMPPARQIPHCVAA